MRLGAGGVGRGVRIAVRIAVRIDVGTALRVVFGKVGAFIVLIGRGATANGIATSSLATVSGLTTTELRPCRERPRRPGCGPTAPPRAASPERHHSGSGPIWGAASPEQPHSREQQPCLVCDLVSSGLIGSGLFLGAALSRERPRWSGPVRGAASPGAASSRAASSGAASRRLESASLGLSSSSSSPLRRQERPRLSGEWPVRGAASSWERPPWESCLVGRGLIQSGLVRRSLLGSGLVILFSS